MKSKFESDGTVTAPQCHTCIHWNGDLTCSAFQEGIPLEILTGDVDHTKPYQGDGGILYEADSGETSDAK